MQAGQDATRTKISPLLFRTHPTFPVMPAQASIQPCPSCAAKNYSKRSNNTRNSRVEKLSSLYLSNLETPACAMPSRWAVSDRVQPNPANWSLSRLARINLA